MRLANGLARSFLLLVTAAATVLVLAVPAEAKLLPLEVQITEGDRTVRTAPEEFLKWINNGPAACLFGFLEPLSTATSPETLPLNIRFIIYTDPGRPGQVFTTMEPGIVRRTYFLLSYYRTESGALGQVLPGGDNELFSEGQWVRFSPSFTAMVEEALDTLPPVAAMAPPAHRSAPHPASPEAVSARYRRHLLLLALGLVIVIGLVISLVLWSRRSVRRAELATRQGIETRAA